jgi:hypothetical protein
MHLSTLWRGTLSVYLGIAVFPFLSSAQESKPPAAPQWSVVTMVHVKPNMTANYEAYQKELSAAYKKAGISRIVVQTIVGNLNEFYSITPLKKLADLSGDNPVERSMGPEASAALFQKRVGLYDEVQRIVTADRPDLSLRAGAPGLYALIVTVRTMPGRRSEYESTMKSDMLPALKKAGFTNVWSSDSVFGGAHEQVVVVPLKDTGDLDKGPPLVLALGPEAAAKLEARLDAMTQHSEMRIVKVRPELSNMPAPETATK